MTTPTDSPRLLRIDALGAVDGVGAAVSPASALIEAVDRQQSIYPGRLLAIGTPSDVDFHEAAQSPRLTTIRRQDAILIPGLVNTHTHLDLTHIGPQPHDPAGGFGPWIEMVRSRRQTDPEAIRNSVRRGVELSMQAGVVAVGDIAGAVVGRASLAAHEAIAATPILGVSFVEFFALGTREEIGLDGLRRVLDEAERRGLLNLNAPLQLGFQPHAPYSVSPAAYLKAAVMVAGRARMCTHLAESIEERMLIVRGAGPLRRMLEEFGIWSEDLEGVFGQQRTPVEHVRECALWRIPLFAHVNDAVDGDLNLLARAGASVAYCPRASSYFGAERHFGAHRYRDMLARGINVALGTDSVVNLSAEAGIAPEESPSGRGMSILDEARFLHSRDGTDAIALLRMATVNGAKALGLDPSAFSFEVDKPLAGLVALPVPRDGPPPRSQGGLAASVLNGPGRPELLFAPRAADSAQSGRVA